MTGERSASLPVIGWLRADHRLDVLGMEALGAATVLDADVHLFAQSAELPRVLEAEGSTATTI